MQKPFILQTSEALFRIICQIFSIFQNNFPVSEVNHEVALFYTLHKAQ